MANKKINQLVLKTTIQPTDLFPLGDATTGQLFKKTVAELQAAIGGAVISVNGLVGTVVLDTDDIQELASPTNRYFTEARARAAISLTTTGSSGASTYSSSTGVLNVPTYTLAGLGGITASFLSGGTGITYNSGTGVISYSGTVYTDASIRALFSAGTGLSYNSSTGAFTNTAPDQTVAIAGGTGISVTGTYPSFTVAYSGTVYTDSSIRGLFSGTAPISFNSSTGAISISQATTSTNGFLSSTDWNTFNGKQSALTIGNLTEATSSVLTITGGTGAVIGSGTSIQVKQASSTVSGFLSSTDWSTFNSKQGTITLTTTGTSGAATLSGSTLNIPQYQGVLTNPVTGTGTTNYVTKWTSSSAIGNSQIFDNGTNVGVGTASPNEKLHVSGNISVVSSSGNKIGFNTSDAFSALGTSVPQYGMAYGWSTQPLGLSGYYGLAFFSEGSERMRITSAGNVEVKSAGQLIAYRSDNARSGSFFCDNVAVQLTSSNDPIRISSADRTEFYTGGSERMRITSAGNVGIGTTSPTVFGGGMEIQRSAQAALRVSCTTGTLTGGVEFGYEGNDGAYIQTVQANGRLTIYTGNANVLALRITAGGNTLLGTSVDNGERLYVSGSIRATGSITANSDVRLKKNIERIENALQKVSEISGYTYNTIYDEDRHAGVIAQEIDKVLPEIVNKGNDGLMGVEYGNISALLIEAIKDLKKDNESLRAIVEGLTK